MEFNVPLKILKQLGSSVNKKTMRKHFYSLILLLVIFSSCQIDRLSKFCEAVIIEDVQIVQERVNDIIQDLEPIETIEDPRGHLLNLDVLISELNLDLCMSASLLCYACIETLPEQSEVVLRIDDGGFITEKIIDVATPIGTPMFFVGMHD
ncbi:MAG: hypothetical protein HKO66_05545 [Saprospiraceae bacterium]|nr:hypothetical protein [Bacteroidia bacterium]NNL91673.1 hypothetical protein [Saprospiraceae bacterium]